MTNMQPSRRVRIDADAGFSMIELIVSMAIMLVIMGATMTAMTHAIRANQTAVLVTGMNNNLRTGMDLMIRDLLQVGSGLPTGHFILIPSGGSSQRINLPGPPGPTVQSLLSDIDFNAVNPGPGLGPVINGVATDTLTFLTADSTFNDIALTARDTNGTWIDVNPAVNIGSGVDKVSAGQLIMLEKGSYAVLLQVTSVDPTIRRIYFAGSDSLNLNQHNAASGSTLGLKAWLPSTDLVPITTVPATLFLSTTATRIRMISYYIDATADPAHPRLVRRVNNGSASVFSNDSGNAVAFDIENLQFTFDIADGATNPANQRCLPGACAVNQIRKVNVVLTGRSRSVLGSGGRFFRNALATQVSLRGMSFVNEYSPPVAPVP